MDRFEKRGLDYYGVLGLTKGALDEEIKEAYKRLSLQYNPIRNKDPDLEELFSLVGEAFEVLVDPRLKCIYDQYGEDGLKKGVYSPFGWNPPWQYHGEPIRTFKRFFGTSNPYADLMYCMRDRLPLFDKDKPKHDKIKQPAIERDLELTLEEVFFGTTKKLKIQRRVYDEEQITSSVKEKVLCIRIKPGLPNGTRMIYRNMGDEGPTIIPGDLIITTKDIPHKRFRRVGQNLYMDVNLELHRSLGGLTIELDTIDKRTIRFSVTDIIVPGYTKIIPNEGMPFIDDNLKKGDLILVFDVTFPKYLTEKTKEKILAALAEEDMNSPEIENQMWLVEKMKKTKQFKTMVTTSVIKDEKRCDDFIEINKEFLFKL